MGKRVEEGGNGKVLDSFWVKWGNAYISLSPQKFILLDSFISVVSDKFKR